MIHVSEQELLERDAKCIEKAEIYRHYVFALEVYRARSEKYLADLKMGIRRAVSGKISETELNTRAIATDEWGRFLQNQLDILSKAGVAKIEYQQAVQSYEAMRSALSSRKTEVSRGM